MFHNHFMRLATATAILLAASAAQSSTINFSVSTPYLGPNPDAAGLVLDGPANSGTFTLTPGVAQDENIWLYNTLGAFNGDFSNDHIALNLILDGISVPVPVLANHSGFTFTYVADGTATANLPGIGIVDVTVVPHTTTFGDPAHAGPVAATFLLKGAAVPEPSSLMLFGIGLAAFRGFRQKPCRYASRTFIKIG